MIVKIGGGETPPSNASPFRARCDTGAFNTPEKFKHAMTTNVGGGETPPPIPPRFARGVTEAYEAGRASDLQFVPPLPDGRAGFGFSSADVFGSLRCRLSECGCFVSGKADGSFVVVLVGPAHPTAPMPMNNTMARNARDLVIVGHLRDERIARAVPLVCDASGTVVAAIHRRTTMVRDPQWPREFLDKRLRTIKALAKQRRNTPAVIDLRRRTGPRPRTVAVTPIA
jgi:hypothetical protein